MLWCTHLLKILITFSSGSVLASHSIWIFAQDAKDTIKHKSEKNIIKCNPLNKSRSIKINEALTQEFMESEPAVVYINKQKRNHTTQALMLVALLERMSKSKLKFSKHSFSKPKWIACRHYLSIKVQIIGDQPFGNGGEWIYRYGNGVKISPKIGECPHLKEEAHRDNIKGYYWENSTTSTMSIIQLFIMEASRSQSFSSSFGKLAFYGSAQVSRPKLH